jgi:hypothetical protein
MWLITYHAVPKPNSPEFQKSGGAYVSCWILYTWQDGAEALSRYEVEKEWTITDTEEISWYDVGDIEDDSPHKEFFDQAMIDGGTFVYNLYPIDADDVNEDSEDGTKATDRYKNEEGTLTK